MLAIALSSFKEAVRKKIIVIIGILTVLYIILFSIIINYAMAEMRDSNAGYAAIMSNVSGFITIIGFYFSSMLVALVTIMASAGAVASEVESGVIHAVIAKPLRRVEYVFGKYLGIAVIVSGYSAILYIFLITINIVFHIPPLNSIAPGTFFAGLALFCLEPLVLLSFCIFGSVCWKTMNNGIIAIGIYILGIIGGMMEQIGFVAKLGSLANWGIVISLLSPFESVYRKMISVIYSSTNFIGIEFAGPFFISGNVPSGWMVVYAVLFQAFFLLMSVRRFSRRDIS